MNETNDHNLPGWKVPKNYLRGYTGNKLSHPLEDDALDTFYRRRMIRGYSGFVPDSRTISGRPIIPSDDVQRLLIEKQMGIIPNSPSQHHSETQNINISSFREYAEHMDLLERYSDATNQLLARGQTPEMLLKLVQAKISERVHAYSEQLITVKLHFQAVSEKYPEGFNEKAFRGSILHELFIKNKTN